MVEPLHLLLGVLLDAQQYIWNGGHGRSWADYLGLRDWSKFQRRARRFFGADRDGKLPLLVRSSVGRMVAVAEGRAETPEELLAEGGLDRATMLVIDAADAEATRHGHREVRTTHLLLALLENDEDIPVVLLVKTGMRIDTLRMLLRRDISEAR